MGTTFEVRLPATAPSALALANDVLDEIDRLEVQLTVYRDDSEVSRINREAHLGPIAVEPGLFGLLDTARRLWERTAGAYDVTSGALSVAWGFFKGPRRVPDAEELADARARTGQHLVRLDPEAGTVRFDRPGLVINLGSIGKGYALDRAAQIIRDHWWYTPGLLHGGRSSIVAVGSPPWDFGGRWEVSLTNPQNPGRPLGVVRLRNRAMGTSGASYQQFEANGRRYGHIVDPRTGEPPPSGPASVSVLAPTAAEADALSTAFYLICPDEAAGLLAERPDVGAIFALDDGRGRLRLQTINVGLADFEPVPGLPSLPPPEPRRPSPDSTGSRA